MRRNQNTTKIIMKGKRVTSGLPGVGWVVPSAAHTMVKNKETPPSRLGAVQSRTYSACENVLTTGSASVCGQELLLVSAEIPSNDTTPNFCA